MAQASHKFKARYTVSNTAIQMNRKEVTKTFMMILNRKNPLVSMVYTYIIQRCEG